MANIWIHLVAVALFMAVGVTANAGEPVHGTKMVVALSTDDFDLAETDISDLAIGDAKTFYTDSGKTVDLLRTEDGVEVYVDGELLDVDHDGVHGDHVIVHKRVESYCESETDCEDAAWTLEDGESDMESLQGDAHEKTIIVIRKEVETD